MSIGVRTESHVEHTPPWETHDRMDASWPIGLDENDREGAVSAVEDYAGQHKGYAYILGGRE